MALPNPIILAPTLAWIDLEFMPMWKAALIFGALAVPILFFGMRSLAGLGPVRKWVAIGARLVVLLMLVLILGGVRWQRQHKSLELVVLRDNSRSIEMVPFPGKNMDDSLDAYLRAASDEKFKISKDDRIGVISFDSVPRIDSMPSPVLQLDSRGIRERGNGTDIASAIQLAMASFSRDAMHRILLICDGNQTAGDLESALAAAVSQNIPIDVMKLRYAVKNEILIDRLSAPSFRKEGDPFDIYVSLISTNLEPTAGKLTVLEDDQPLIRRPIVLEPATLNADGAIEPRKHVERVHVPAIKSSGVRPFKAIFEPEVINPRNPGGGVAASVRSQPGDTMLENNVANAFTLVRGQGRVLYVDNSRPDSNGVPVGITLFNALKGEAINVERVNIDQVPQDLVKLQNYDAVILNNVPRGRTAQSADGLDEKQDVALASYVHDFGGGLIMIGGPDSFGAGGWQGSKIEEVLPVNMDIPAQRQMPKGALVLVIHSCEMPNGNYWGEQCAIKGVETLSGQDEVGVISYGWNGQGNGIGGSSWDFLLAPKLDGSRPIAAIKKMQPGDMPSFDDCLTLAINGVNGGHCLSKSNAAQKHVIIISDGDPQPPNAKLMAQIIASKISISTVSVYPHGGNVPGTMQDIAKKTGGNYYGPIEKNPGQLPQIFIKEASVVRRTLIQEQEKPPISVQLRSIGSEIMNNVPQPPPITGFVLTDKKNNATVYAPLLASLDGKKWDPLFVHWQAGLGKTAVFTGDAAVIWTSPWMTPEYRGSYGKLFAQMVRGVSRPPMSTDFAVSTERVGDKARINVEVTNKEGFTNFLNIRGTLMDPDGKQHGVKLVQTGPGTYVGEFAASHPGNYVASLSYKSPDGKDGWLATGLAVNDSPETRELRSNDQLLEEIAKRTGGRIIPIFDSEGADLFSRQNIKVSSSPLPVWDILLPILLGLIVLDVAIRRIAWDWQSTKRLAVSVGDRVKEFTLTRKVEAKPTLDALKRVRDEVAETRFKVGESGPPPLPTASSPSVNRSAKFEAEAGVEGDITAVVGGASDKPLPAAPKKIEPKGAPAAAGGHTGSLLEAKRRAQQQIKKKEQGE